MQISTFIATSLLCAGAIAQSTISMSAAPMASSAGGAGAAGSPTQSAAGGMTTVHVIKAGNEAGELVFAPNNIQANVGDMVQFQFYPKNHSVVMSNFAQPCVPIQQSDPANAANAFFSGFVPTTEMGRLTYTIQVTSPKPIWFYCSQGKHCQAGMVGAINAPAQGNTIDAFAAAAKNAPNNVTPAGPPAAAGSGAASSSAGTTAPTGGATTPSGASSASGAAPAQQTTNAAPRTGAEGLLGLVFAAVVGVVVL
ncbi:Cupredoxin [Aulographum hederae CBS 113979]|uniref:Cupredoxin n=1 Tax=Aulographum hederae CBS 113979 TaxID=1176131 RepID=A0A6G1H093_9PEZI|nr:Cupredoxin [Aulographum hederae CBS 113979]